MMITTFKALDLLEAVLLPITTKKACQMVERISISVTDLERLLMDGASQRIDDPFLDVTLH